MLSKFIDGTQETMSCTAIIGGFWNWLTIYRQLFAWIVTGNLAFAIAASSGAFPWAFNNRVQLAAANILISVLARNEITQRIVYAVLIKFVTIGSTNGLGTLWAPVWLRNLLTNFLLHIGGIHSGCGTASVIWLIYGAVYLVKDHAKYDTSVVVLGYVLLACIVVACASATPCLRFKFHDIFEHLHRYSGWTSLVVMVAFIVRLYNNGPALWTTFLTTYWFWITVFTIVLVALPWAWVAKVAIDPKASPSGRVSLLRFPGNVTSGLYGRISRGSLTEWHVFGCFSESESAADSIPHHYMLCSAVGGFTKELVANPPTALYTRTIKLPGFSYCHRMYNGGVAICTGAAIGVFISLFSNKGLSNFSLIWVGSKFEATYGKQVMEILRNNCPPDKLTLYDTAVHGRPDLVELAAAAYQEQEAEVVFCVSNLEGTKAIVRGCRSRGIPAFGPIWDA